jgi:CheY-like chemotaxis protein
MPELRPTLIDLEQQVLDCLTHLYDFMFLQDHPLVEALVPEVKGPKRIQEFREIIIGCIESMRPTPDLETQPKVSRLYNILRLRYIRQQTVQQVNVNLSLSERQFYRDLPKAIQVLSQMLHERITGETVAPVVIEADEEPASIQSEVERVRTEVTAARIELKGVIDGALAVIHSLIEQNQVSVTNHMTSDISIADADRTIVRQILILIFSQLATGASQIDISSTVAGRFCQVMLQTYPREHLPVSVQPVREVLANSETLAVLLNTIEAKLSSQSETEITLHIQLRQTSVLVIDDNPNIISLFRRYVTGLPYHLLEAANSSEAVELARRLQPQLIILDVMLPGQDGWEILQNLKNHPATLAIPILVCSVLDLPDVATSLGADGYLKKTPGQAEFLKVLARWSA